MMFRFFLFAWALLLCWPAFADTGVRIVVPNHDIARGETIQQSDLTYKTVADNTMFNTVTSMKDLVGMAARRMLRAGDGVRMEDVHPPTLVVKGSTVTMTFEAPGIQLTAVGRAMSEGGMGETVTVQNPVSFRQISAVVTGPGQVRALSAGASASPLLASNRP
ncbi:MAG: flagellar basal body P-ring formation protein FlgA [Alphaproteobacteria bacterium]|nr:flagellar basal body P-ring formation protein FlgA [Alphaproteobacteria bacterium]MDE2264310.1 flagellar basal body P-ring formation protein FlgA [Alphaproteobacteria bacterium]MDE2499986.1 flagellar basal body P-ring formation protein FlgA [Alphaproteobacteria bacterium]